MDSNCSCSEQHQAKLWIGSFALTEDSLGHFAEQGQTNPGLIIALHIQKRLDEFALINANQIPGLTLKIPDTNMGEQLQSRTKAALGQPGPFGDPAQASRLAVEKADQAIPFTQREAAQNNCFRLVKRHPFLSARRRPRSTHQQNGATKFLNFVNYHTKRHDAIENMSPPQNLFVFQRLGQFI